MFFFILSPYFSLLNSNKILVFRVGFFPPGVIAIDKELQYQKEVLINSKFKNLVSLNNFISCFQLIEKEDGNFPYQFPFQFFDI